MLLSILKNLRGAYALAPLRTAKMAINRAAVFMVRLDFEIRGRCENI